MAKDYYNILGIDRSASQEEVKKAFHRLAHKHHPNKGGSEEKFKEINEAYQILSNKEKRAQYDQFGRVFEGGMPGGGAGAGGQPGWDFSWFWGNRPGGGFSADDGFSAEGGPASGWEMGEMGDLGDIFEDLFGFGGGGARRTRKTKDLKRGRDLRVELEISLEDTLKETKKTISLKKLNVCKRCSGTGAEPGTKINECFSCRGTGYVQQIKKTIFGSFTQSAICPECNGEGRRPEKPCNVCKGEGRIKSEEDVEIFIPAGVDTNQMIKIAGKGEAGRKGGQAGDLYIRILVKKHPVFERKGDDLYISRDISFVQAALGDEVEVSTLGGTKILLSVSEGTESGKILRISEKGIPHFGVPRGYPGRGNLYVELNVKIPKKLTKKQKELLEELKEEGI